MNFRTVVEFLVNPPTVTALLHRIFEVYNAIHDIVGCFYKECYRMSAPIRPGRFADSLQQFFFRPRNSQAWSFHGLSTSCPPCPRSQILAESGNSGTREIKAVRMREKVSVGDDTQPLCVPLELQKILGLLRLAPPRSLMIFLPGSVHSNQDAIASSPACQTEDCRDRGGGRKSRRSSDRVQLLRGQAFPSS